MRDGWRRVTLGEALTLVDDRIPVMPGEQYDLAGVYSFGRGLFRREPLLAEKTSYKHLNVLRADRFVMSKLKAWEGAITVIGSEFDGAVLSPEFPTYDIDDRLMLPSYLRLVTTYELFWNLLATKSTGMGGRKERVHQGRILELELDLPALAEQARIVDVCRAVDDVRMNAVRTEAAAWTSLMAMARHYLSDSRGLHVKLDDVAGITMGQSPPGSACNTDEDGEPLLNGPTEFTAHIVGAPRQWTTAGSKHCQAGDILFCVRGATAGRINRASYPAAIGRGLASIRAETESDTALVRFALLVGRDRLLPEAGGTIFPNISGRALRELEVRWPSSAADRDSHVETLLAIESYVEALRSAAPRLLGLRDAMIRDLLSGAHEIPASYDELLERAS